MRLSKPTPNSIWGTVHLPKSPIWEAESVDDAAALAAVVVAAAVVACTGGA